MPAQGNALEHAEPDLRQAELAELAELDLPAAQYWLPGTEVVDIIWGAQT